MQNSNNNNWLYESPLFKNKNQRYYYDFGTGNKIEREEVKKQRDAFLDSVSGGSNKPQNQQRDDFLEGFSDPYGEKREQERKERLAKIRENYDNRFRSFQSTLSSQTDPFLEGFNQDSTEENKRILDLFKKKTTGILNPKLSDDTNRALNELQRAFRGPQFEGELKPTVQRFNPSSMITTAINRNPNAQNEIELIGTDDPNKEPVITQFSNDKTKKENTNVVDAVFPFVSPEFHKKVWSWGADNYLTKKGYNSSAWLLKHSLEDNPKDVYRDNNSRLAQLIKNDPAFLTELDKAIAESDGKTLDTTLNKVMFESGDLYYSIHKGKIKVTGQKGNNGKWKISARLTDEYDFSEIMSWMNGKDATLGTLANDMAVFSSKLGAITPYYIYVDFNLER